MLQISQSEIFLYMNEYILKCYLFNVVTHFFLHVERNAEVFLDVHVAYTEPMQSHSSGLGDYNVKHREGF